MSLELPLATLQSWMQRVVVFPGTVEDALREDGAPVGADELDGVVLPSPTLTPAERVGIYHGMYLLRMTEALESDYPAVRHFLGEAGFQELVHAYVQVHPSRSHTLNRLGDHLPEFIVDHPGLDRRGFLHDLARLELAVTEVFDAPETPTLSQADVARVSPETWANLRLKPVAAFRLLALQYPANDYLQSVYEEDHAHPAARRKKTWVVVCRRDYSMRRLELTRAGHDLLADLVSGSALGDAVSTAIAEGLATASAESRSTVGSVSGPRRAASGERETALDVVGLEGLEPSTNRL